jgi:hypothetical protein
MSNENIIHFPNPELENLEVHLNVPRLAWQAVEGMAEASSDTMTNIVLGAINHEAKFRSVLYEEPGSEVLIRHADGTFESVEFRL